MSGCSTALDGAGCSGRYPVSPRSVGIVILALLFGGAAAAGITIYLNDRSPVQADDTVPVVEAAADIPRFTTITARLVRVRPYPKNRVPPGAVTKVEDALDRAAVTHLVKGEALMTVKLAEKGKRGIAAA